MTAEPDRLPSETLSPLAARVDEALALYGYELEPAIEAIDAAVPGYGGLFDPGTTDDERRAAVDDVLGTADQSPPSTTALPSSDLVLYVDGSSRGNPGPAGAGAVLLADEEELVHMGRPVGSHAGNNVAEYAALQLGLDAAVRRFDATALEVRIDSMTVIEDVWGEDDNATPADTYRAGIERHLSALRSHHWTHLADHEYNPADARATVGADIAALGPG